MATSNDELADLFMEWREAWIRLERFAHTLAARSNLTSIPTRRYVSELEFEKFCRLDQYQASLLGELLKTQCRIASESQSEPSSPTGGKLAISIQEAADELGVGRSTLYEAVRRGQIHSIKIGKRRLISRRSLDELFARPSDNPESEHTTIS